MRRIIAICIGLGLFLAAAAPSTFALPWDVYQDPISGEVCDLINGQNAEFVAFTDTGELVIVSGDDVFLGDSLVDLDGNVFFDGLPFGVIAFATDGNGLRSLWWLTDAGTVVSIDPDTLFPFDSLAFPQDFVGVECGACPFWDHPEDCLVVIVDGDGDGVTDDVDLCPGTLPGEIIDIDGCSCEDRDDCDCFFDSDLDGVADCDDFCTETPLNSDVDIDGCACFEVDDDGDGIVNCDDLCPNTQPGADIDVDGCTVVVVTPTPVVVACGNFGALMLGLTFTGLFMMRFADRRW